MGGCLETAPLFEAAARARTYSQVVYEGSVETVMPPTRRYGRCNSKSLKKTSRKVPWGKQSECLTEQKKKKKKARRSAGDGIKRNRAEVQKRRNPLVVDRLPFRFLHYAWPSAPFSGSTGAIRWKDDDPSPRQASFPGAAAIVFELGSLLG